MYLFIFAGLAFLTGMSVNNVLRKIMGELLEETERFEDTTDTFLKQMKLKYENYIKIGHEINNTEAFAGKYLEKYKHHGVSIHGYEKIAALCAGLSVVCGVCGALVDKSHVMEYLLIGFLAMYVITGTGRMLDISEKKKAITLNIVDYFENKFYIAASKEPENKVTKVSKVAREEQIYQNTSNIVSPEERKLIDEILREYLG